MPSDMYQEKIRVISVYAYDIYKALWYHEVCKMKNKKTCIEFVQINTKVLKILSK